MLALLSPAKTLDENAREVVGKPTRPALLKETETLAHECEKLSEQKIKELMGVSDKIALLNYGRFGAFTTPFTENNAKQAIYMFKGDVYTGLDVGTLPEEDVMFLNDHVAILSGLYGLLKPLDLMQAYRLEMGTKLKNPKGEDLYQFWGGAISAALNAQLKNHEHEVLLNLASNEYFKAVDRSTLHAPVVDVVFKENKNGALKVIGIHAKKARGTMARYIAQHKIDTPEDLKKFKAGGYAYNEELSTATELVFIR